MLPIKAEIPMLATAARPPSPKLSPADAAKFLAVSPRTLKRWRSQGEGPTVLRIGRLVRYDVADLEAWAAEHRRGQVRTAGAPFLA